MSPTDHEGLRDLAGALFDEVIMPLHEARATAGEPAYFPTAPDPAAATYYSPPLLRAMRPEDFEFPGGGTVEGIVDALTGYWSAQGEVELAATTSRLKQMAEAARNEAYAGDGSVSVFCYTMF